MLLNVLEHPIKTTLLTLVVLAICLFPINLFLRVVSFGLSSYCRLSLGAKLSYEEMAWKNGEIAFKNGKITKPDHFELQFSQASLHPRIDWREKKFCGKLDVDQLTIVQSQRSGFCFRPIPFCSDLKTVVRKGTLFVTDQKIEWEMEGAIKGQEVVERVAVRLEPESRPLVLHYLQRRDGKAELSAAFDSHALAHLSHVVRYYMEPHLMNPNTHWEFAEGVIDGVMGIAWQGSEIGEIRGQVHLTEVLAENPSLALSGAVDKLSLNLCICPSKCDEWDGEIELHHGSLAFQGRHRDLWRGMWDLNIDHTQLLVKQGRVESSLFEANLLGMKGEWSLDWLSEDLLMRLTFSGCSEEMVSFLPPSIQDAFSEAFPSDLFQVDAFVKRGKVGLELEGKILIGSDEQTLTFGCSFGDRFPPSYPAAAINDTFMESLKEQFCLCRKRHGWLRGKELPIEQFLSPFLFHGIRMDGFGQVDFEATFDDRFLVIFYQAKEFSLESRHFSLKTDRVGGDGGEITAVHYIDLDTLEHLGFLPLTDTTYVQKNFDLTFTDAKAIVYFENEKIRVEQIEMKRDELLFQGEMGITINHIDDVDLTLTTHHIHGPVSQAQDLLSHFVPSVCWALPFDGCVECADRDIFFHFAFQPKFHLLEGRIRGELHADYRSAPLTVSDISTTFDYDFQANRMIFTEGAGHFMLNETSYRLVVPEAAITEFPHQQIALEMGVWHENEKILSLKGRTEGDQLKRQLFIDSNFFTLRGEQEGSRVSIHRFRSEKCAGTAEIDWTEKSCHIDNLELLAQGIGAFSLEGALNRQTWTFNGRINDFEVHLDTFSSHPSVKKVLALWNPEGTIRGKGGISYQLTEKKLEVETQATFAGLEFGGVHFGDGEDLTCHYRSDQGLTVEGLAVDIPGAEKYKLGQFHYHLESQKILFDSFDFSLPPEKLPWITEMLTRLFPGKIHPTIVDWALALKENEPLDGKISLELFPKQVWIHLTLKDGLYALSGKQLDLKNFSLSYDPLELKLKTQYRYLDDYYWVDLLVDSMTMSHGEAAIEDDSGRLAASWERRQDRGWCVKNLHGAFCGLDVSLDAKENLDFSKTVQLAGRIGVDLERASRLMSPDLQKIVAKLGMGPGYILNGDFTCPKNNPSDFHFSGTLSGEEFFLGGAQLNSLSSHVAYTGERFELIDLAIEDWSGSLRLPQAMMTKQNGRWIVEIPHIALDRLHPARLRSERFKKSKKSKNLFKSLFITSGELHQLRGIVGEQTSFEGSGDLQFTNLPKKNFLSPVLYLPTEITARIGLDLGLLVPARGTIRYEIMDGRIYLTKFKDMYSEGKRSRFYLAEGHPSYIDFDGNLYMKVKMKQYNLLMKLAEFFTVTVKGTIFKPAYTLTNQFDE